MNKKFIVFAFLVILIALGVVFSKSFFIKKESPETQYPITNVPDNQPEGDIVVTGPVANQTVGSPIALTGKARGFWFFEATAPVKVLDIDGSVIGQGYITAVGEWMTTDYVNFTGSVPFRTPKGTAGQVIFMKDNPSGLPENDKQISIPVKFSSPTSIQPSGTCAPDKMTC